MITSEAAMAAASGCQLSQNMAPSSTTNGSRNVQPLRMTRPTRGMRWPSTRP